MQKEQDVSRSAKDVLATLPANVIAEFSLPAKTHDRGEGPYQIHTVRYDQRVDPVCRKSDLPTGISTQQIISLLNSTANYFGILWESQLVLNIKENSSGYTGKLLIFDSDTLNRALNTIYPEHNLTHAEKRTLYQVICGLSMREAAELDGSSPETKRSQIKSVRAKTGLGRQADIATYTVTRLLMDTETNVSNHNSSHQCIRDYHKDHMPSTVRLHILVGDSGYQHRVLDMGPSGGNPFITLHPQIVPYLRNEDVDVLHKYNLRLIWPLRNGSLAPSDKLLDFNEHSERCLEAIDVASQLTGSNKKIKFLALMSGGFYAINFAYESPHKVDKIVFVGACYKNKTSEKTYDIFRNGMTRITSRSPLLTRVLLSFLGSKLRDKSLLTDFLEGLYKDSEADMKIVQKELSDEGSFNALQKRVVCSARSIAQDFFFMTSPNWNLLEELECELHFLHGAEDPAHSVEDISELAKSRNARLDILENVGQMVYYEHIEAVAKRL